MNDVDSAAYDRDDEMFGVQDSDLLPSSTNWTLDVFMGEGDPVELGRLRRALTRVALFPGQWDQALFQAQYLDAAQLLGVPFTTVTDDTDCLTTECVAGWVMHDEYGVDWFEREDFPTERIGDQAAALLGLTSDEKWRLFFGTALEKSTDTSNDARRRRQARDVWAVAEGIAAARGWDLRVPLPTWVVDPAEVTT